eukprot:1353998-Amorphochlora_amoeboformis.AAC.3
MELRVGGVNDTDFLSGGQENTCSPRNTVKSIGHPRDDNSDICGTVPKRRFASHPSVWRTVISGCYIPSPASLGFYPLDSHGGSRIESRKKARSPYVVGIFKVRKFLSTERKERVHLTSKESSGLVSSFANATSETIQIDFPTTHLDPGGILQYRLRFSRVGISSVSYTHLRAHETDQYL